MKQGTTQSEQKAKRMYDDTMADNGSIYLLTRSTPLECRSMREAVRVGVRVGKEYMW